MAYQKISTVSLKVITAHVRVTKWTCTNSVSPNCSGYKLKIGYAKVKGCTIFTDSIKTFTQNENEETFPLSSKNGTTFTFIPKNTSNERLIVVVVDDRDNFQATTCEDLHKRHEQGNKTFIHTDAYFALGSAKYRWTRNNQVNDYYTSSKIKKELSDHSERKEEHTVNKKKKKKRKKECDSETKSNTPNVKTEGKQGSHEHADQTRQSNSNKSKKEENVSKTNGNESFNKDEITPLEYQCEVSKIDENTPSKKSKCKKDKKKFDKDEQDKQKDNENNSMEAQIEHHNEQSKHNESQASEEVLSGRCKYIPVAEKGDCSVENKNDESRLERSKSVIDENANSIRKLEMRNTDSENKRSKSARASNSKNKRSPNTRLHLQNFTGSSEEAVLCVAIS
ncbi:unnamed protein product [Mytilus coruscus]|uniref:Uncharacterized protein n=1 Tax=Mytilus coruscus TaxID=42192 RepID=A0A6J8BGA3_MYTCO|nr:unnamed protein product [Mytilus coruscus]